MGCWLSTVLALGGLILGTGQVMASGPDFTRSVRPILAAKCYACHGPDAEARKAGLRLDTVEGATILLKSGGVAIVPGKPSQPAAGMGGALRSRRTHAAEGGAVDLGRGADFGTVDCRRCWLC